MGGLLWHISKNNDAWHIISDLGSEERYDLTIDKLSETFPIFRRTRVIALTPSQTLMSVAMLELPSMPRICLYPPL